MNFEESFKSNLFSVTPETFDQKAMELFEYQFETNLIYRAFSEKINKTPNQVHNVSEIPFLPIELFKNHEVKSGKWQPKLSFLSSGTTGLARSRHLVRDPNWYLSVAKRGFETFYGPLSEYTFLNLLPSYQSQKDSSLIYMVDYFMSQANQSSRYINSINSSDLIGTNKKLLLGVSYALLDIAESEEFSSENLLVMETGGMKGRRKEITREQLHGNLKTGFKQTQVHSEYGMTELFSQAYSKANGKFKFPTWCQVWTRDINDPLEPVEDGKTGGINIIDLANVDTCAFIETKDLGKKVDGEQFEVLGRYDNSDIRGCNLLTEI